MRGLRAPPHLALPGKERISFCCTTLRCLGGKIRRNLKYSSRKPAVRLLRCDPTPAASL
jgi:hypothetical protein